MTSTLVSSLLVLAIYTSLAAAAPVEFNRDVRPILSDKCFSCHGPDAEAKKIPLRLDSEASAKADLGGGRRAVVAGDPDASSLVQRITADKPALRMPPVHSGLHLREEEVRTIQEWIQQGAKWQKHWAFLPPARKSLPEVSGAAWTRNEIDYFVLQQLEREGLKPSPEAARETLIRRVSLDLTGLPPTVAEVDAFLADTSPEAYEKVVDRLLASPRYGERMAARWLDAARYADTNGYQFDGERTMWRWRDWVIASFNRNQPYDRFTLEQIAGDLLPDATLDQKIATGFNRNHRANTEDGIIAEEYAVEYVVDRVETTSTVFLGLTMGCARCHNHKYDPLSQEEFYRMFAYFNNVPELGRAMKYGNSPPLIPAPTREQQGQLEAVNRRIAAEEQVLDRNAGAIAAGQRRWLSTVSDRTAHWAPSNGLLSVFSMEEDGGSPGRFGKAAHFDGKAVREFGPAGPFDIESRFTLATWIHSSGQFDGSIVSRMADNPKGKGYGVHADRGKIHVNLTSVYADDAIRLETEETLAPNEWHHVLVTYNGSRMADGVKVYIDGKQANVKVLLDTLYRPFSNAGKPFKEPFRAGAGWGPERRFRGSIDEIRIYDRVLRQDEITALAVGKSIPELAAKDKLTEAEERQLRWQYLEHAAAPEMRESWKRLTGLEQQREALERTFPTVMIMAESPRPKDTFLLIRGAYDKHGKRVEPGVPGVLNPLPAGAPANRLALAQWMIDPANPLTARVAVNRFWQTYFGAGIVTTAEDFGLQGDWPSHPDLLDWLATEFVRTGWDVKAMQKRLVMSATYRQQSQASPELLRRDPGNRLLARGPRHRLAAEMARDQALFAAGLLVEKEGGPSVKPYQPEGLWNEQAMQDMRYVQSKGGDLYRRSLYTFWKRTIPPPMMMNFDAAGREACVVSETRTNTPLQALNLMNDVTFTEASRFIAGRMLKEAGSSPADRLRYGFRLVVSRNPKPAELKLLEGSLTFHKDFFASDPARATAILAEGEKRSDPDLNPGELAAYAAVASLILNLDEAITIQ